MQPQKNDTPSPVPLRADNFTPPSRTPWGGRHLLEHLKRGLSLDPERAAWAVVGESWELSVEPSFPSILRDAPVRLQACIASAPDAWLGEEVAARQPSTGLLLKLLDTAAPLSVQIHPADDDPRLSPEQSGKPEAWYVVRREPGAGILLGWRPEANEEVVRRILSEGGDLSRLLQFVPVEAGDVFVVPPGTPHAIGAGLTLVEPQRVLPGRHGVTWRYWDWNRRYDERGRLAPRGTPRPLHIEEALGATDWSASRGAGVRERLGHRAPAAPLDGPLRIEPLIGPRAPLRLDPIRLTRCTGTGLLQLPAPGRLTGVLVLRGRIERLDVPGPFLRYGECAAWPATRPVQLRAFGAEFLLASAD